MSSKVPERILALVDAGIKLREDECSRRITKFEADRHLKDEQLLQQKSWGHLVVEAKIKLDQLAEYVNWNMPSCWSSEKGQHWFIVSVPGLSEIVVEYRRYKDSLHEWYLNCWGVAFREFPGGKTWIVYDACEYQMNFILAAAYEQFGKKKKPSNPDGYKEFGNAQTHLSAGEIKDVVNKSEPKFSKCDKVFWKKCEEAHPKDEYEVVHSALSHGQYVYEIKDVHGKFYTGILESSLVLVNNDDEMIIHKAPIPQKHKYGVRQSGSPQPSALFRVVKPEILTKATNLLMQKGDLLELVSIDHENILGSCYTLGNASCSEEIVNRGIIQYGKARYNFVVRDSKESVVILDDIFHDCLEETGCKSANSIS